MPLRLSLACRRHPCKAIPQTKTSAGGGAFLLPGTGSNKFGPLRKAKRLHIVQSFRLENRFAERTRFELVVQVAPYVGLANRWFQPLTHLSGHAFRLLTPKGCANIESFWGNTKNCGQNLYICINLRACFESPSSHII